MKLTDKDFDREGNCRHELPEYLDSLHIELTTSRDRRDFRIKTPLEINHGLSVTDLTWRELSQRPRVSEALDRTMPQMIFSAPVKVFGYAKMESAAFFRGLKVSGDMSTDGDLEMDAGTELNCRYVTIGGHAILGTVRVWEIDVRYGLDASSIIGARKVRAGQGITADIIIAKRVQWGPGYRLLTHISPHHTADEAAKWQAVLVEEHTAANNRFGKLKMKKPVNARQAKPAEL